MAQEACLGRRHLCGDLNKVKEVAMKIYRREGLGSGSSKCKNPVAGIVGNEVLGVSRGLIDREKLFQDSEEEGFTF